MGAMRSRGRPKHDDILTPAEWRTVHAVTHGLTNREIAARRKISLDAVKYHIANALGKLNLDRRMQLKQWFRAPRGSALTQQEHPMETPATLGPIGQIARTVENIERSQAWYRDVLGLPHLYTFGPMAFFDCGGVRLALMQKERAAPEESILYLRGDPIVATYERLKAKGVEFVSAPHLVHRHADGSEEWMAFFKDLEGRTLALIAQVRPSV
jgi:DNA-binding CsgD family transcriptional regulator/catechol 2,3-dioxygenase-like lactoylglutathione lyase family enzyme